MEGFMHWYNLHRKTIWTIIGVAVLIFVMINVINSSLKQKEQTRNTVSINTIKMNSISMDSDTSPITGDQITNNQKNTVTVIDNFATYCNNGDIESAYNLLSSDCKEQMYQTKEDFKTIYYDPVFGGIKREITVENWVGNIYKVKFAENALATGKFDQSNITQDYITIVKENGQTKLNINSYIGKQPINRTQEANNVKIKVVEANTYFDYQSFTFEITNNRDTPILINDPNIDSTMYIEDKNETHYQAYTHELAETDIKIPARHTQTVTIKYYSRYSSNKVMKYTAFDRIVLNYSAYSHYTNIGAYKDYGSIKIERPQN